MAPAPGGGAVPRTLAMNSPEATVGNAPATQPARLPAGRGARWLGDGWAFFAARPLPWLGALLLMVVITICLHFIPLLGSLAAALIGPVFVGGLAIGCRTQENGGTFSVGHLFAGFSGRGSALAMVGGIYLLLILALVAILSAVMALSGFSLFAAGSAPTRDAVLYAALGGLMTLALSVPLAMAYWYAPFLVALTDTRPLAAFGLSFRGCLRNVVPLFVWSLVVLCAWLAALAVLMMLVFVPRLLSGGAAPFAPNQYGLYTAWAAALLALTVAFAPTLLASQYVAFREIFTIGAVVAPGRR